MSASSDNKSKRWVWDDTSSDNKSSGSSGMKAMSSENKQELTKYEIRDKEFWEGFDRDQISRIKFFEHEEWKRQARIDFLYTKYTEYLVWVQEFEIKHEMDEEEKDIKVVEEISCHKGD